MDPKFGLSFCIRPQETLIKGDYFQIEKKKTEKQEFVAKEENKFYRFVSDLV